jgi:hypothetical protein
VSVERVVEELARRMRYLEALKGLAEALLLLVVAALFFLAFWAALSLASSIAERAHLVLQP